MTNLSKDQMRFHVEVEGKASEWCDTADEALRWASQNVYLDPERVDDAKRLLEAGQVFMYSYGFNGVNIVPKPAPVISKTMTDDELAQIRAFAEKAAPGPYVAHDDRGWHTPCIGRITADGWTLMRGLTCTIGKYEREQEQADFWAALWPERVMAMIDELRRYRSAHEAAAPAHPVLEFGFATCVNGTHGSKVTLGYSTLEEAQAAHKWLVERQRSAQKANEQRPLVYPDRWPCKYPRIVGSIAQDCIYPDCDCGPSQPDETAAPQAPIAWVVVADNGGICASGSYAPGLPPGNHDLYCVPDAVAPMMRAEETTAPPASAEGCTTCGGSGWIGCECPACTPEKAAAPPKPPGWFASMRVGSFVKFYRGNETRFMHEHFDKYIDCDWIGDQVKCRGCFESTQVNGKGDDQ